MHFLFPLAKIVQKNNFEFFLQKLYTQQLADEGRLSWLDSFDSLSTRSDMLLTEYAASANRPWVLDRMGRALLN
jgi:hypothetical protein